MCIEKIVRIAIYKYLKLVALHRKELNYDYIKQIVKEIETEYGNQD